MQTLEITGLVRCLTKCTKIFAYKARNLFCNQKIFFVHCNPEKRTLFSLPQLHDPGAKGRVNPVIARVWPIYPNRDLISLQLKKHTLFLPNSNGDADEILDHNKS